MGTREVQAMNRRSFIAAISAALAAPPVMAAPARSEQIPWEFFTDLDLVRWDLSTPWIAGERIVATDARVLMSMLGGSVGDAIETRRPELALIPWEWLNSGGWLSSSSIVPVKPKWKCSEQSCGACFGTGRIGTGVKRVRQRDHCGDLCTVWVGGVECEACEGDGWTRGGPVLMAGSAVFAAHYIERIRLLGDFDFFVDQSPMHPRLPLNLMVFRNAFGAGFLMGLEQ